LQCSGVLHKALVDSQAVIKHIGKFYSERARHELVEMGSLADDGKVIDSARKYE
jgi:hypothetical protein